MNDVQYVQQLALVFVNTLHLNIEYGIGVKLHTAFFKHHVGKTLLVLLPDVVPAFNESPVVHV